MLQRTIVLLGIVTPNACQGLEDTLEKKGNVACDQEWRLHKIESRPDLPDSCKAVRLGHHLPVWCCSCIVVEQVYNILYPKSFLRHITRGHAHFRNSSPAFPTFTRVNERVHPSSRYPPATKTRQYNGCRPMNKECHGDHCPSLQM